MPFNAVCFVDEGEQLLLKLHGGLSLFLLGLKELLSPNMQRVRLQESHVEDLNACKEPDDGKVNGRRGGGLAVNASLERITQAI